MSQRLKKIVRIPLRDQILDSIKRAIITGKFKASEKISEEELAAQLGVSRTPIREAIRVLEQQGLL
ncbi:MAG: GntR family transcriptional regulator, partial [SAR324 cluster bacterium]|nr:GntR family transcriptional regulator [SAR324 cluster bacterium]